MKALTKIKFLHRLALLPIFFMIITLIIVFVCVQSLDNLREHESSVYSEHARDTQIMNTATRQIESHFRRFYSYIFPGVSSDSRAQTINLNKNAEKDIQNAIDLLSKLGGVQFQKNGNESAIAWDEYKESMANIYRLTDSGDTDAALKEINYHADKLHVLIRDSLLKATDAYIRKNGDKSIELIAKTKYTVITLICIALISGVLLTYFIYRSIFRQLGGSPEIAMKMVSDISNGVLISRNELCSDNEGSLLNNLDRMRNQFNKLILGVKKTSLTIVDIAEEIDVGNMSLASRTEEQSAGVTETAATLEQLTSTVQSTSDNVRITRELFALADKAVMANTKSMQGAFTAMNEIHIASEKMTSIISVIEAIAFQTNILALNAAVEAARVGEVGRGFAVVAGEVHNLSQRASDSARDIRDMITLSLSKVSCGRELFNDVDKGMVGIVENMSNVRLLIDNVAVACDQQRDAITQINIAMGQIDIGTNNNAVLVEESSVASQTLKEQSSILLDNIKGFTLSEYEHTNYGTKKAVVVPDLPQSKTLSHNNQDWQSF